MLPPLRPSPASEHVESQSAQAIVDTVENRPEAHSLHVVPPLLLSASVTNPASVQAMHPSSEVAAYRPATHASHTLSVLALPPLKPSPAFEHVDSQFTQALVDVAEKRPELHSVHVVPPSLASVSVTDPAAQAMQSLSELAAY